MKSRTQPISSASEATWLVKLCEVPMLGKSKFEDNEKKTKATKINRVTGEKRTLWMKVDHAGAPFSSVAEHSLIFRLELTL